MGVIYNQAFVPPSLPACRPSAAGFGWHSHSGTLGRRPARPGSTRPADVLQPPLAWVLPASRLGGVVVGAGLDDIVTSLLPTTSTHVRCTAKAHASMQYYTEMIPLPFPAENALRTRWEAASAWDKRD